MLETHASCISTPSKEDASNDAALVLPPCPRPRAAQSRRARSKRLPRWALPWLCKWCARTLFFFFFLHAPAVPIPRAWAQTAAQPLTAAAFISRRLQDASSAAVQAAGVAFEGADYSPATMPGAEVVAPLSSLPNKKLSFSRVDDFCSNGEEDEGRRPREAPPLRRRRVRCRSTPIPCPSSSACAT